MKQLKGTATHRSDGTHVGKTAEDLAIQVTIPIRRRPGHVPMPTFDDYIGCPERKRLSVEDFAKKHGACQADVDAVVAHAKLHGIQLVESHLARRYVKLSGTVGQFNRAYGIETHDYVRDDPYHGTYHYRAHDHVTVPDHLADVVKCVVGIGDGMRYRPANGSGDPAVVQELSPNFVAGLYQGLADDATGQTIGIFGFQGSLTSDWESTISQWGYPNPSVTHIAVDDSPYSNGELEEVLDIAMCGSFGQGADIVVYEPNYNLPTGQNWLDTITRMIHPSTGDTPCDILTFSIIFTGPQEVENAAFIQSTESVFEDAASLGVSIFVATGDQGSSNYATGGGTGNVYIAYPANSAWVTSVGGTTIGANSGTLGTTNYVEWAWNDYEGAANDGTATATGGGVSIILPIPSYQQGYSIPTSLYNGATGRGIPDISGNASSFSGYNIVFQGGNNQIGGTSCTAPMYAGMFARVNAYLGRNVGFLNPSLYAVGSGRIQNAFVVTGSGPTFTDSRGDVWGLTASNGQVIINGVIDNTTSNVINLIYWTLTGDIYQQNTDGSWFTKTSATDSWVILPPNTGNTLVCIRDITTATGGPSNNAITQSGQSQTPGYPVTTGWDAVTGLGVVNIVPFLWYLQNVISITGITLSNTTIASSVASGTVIGAINVQLSTGASFTGTLALTQAANTFQIISGNLCTLGSLEAGLYQINITATQGGSIFTSNPFTITVTPPMSPPPVSPPPVSPPPGPPISPPPVSPPPVSPPSASNTTLTLTWNLPVGTTAGQSMSYVIEYKIASDMVWSTTPLYQNPAPSIGTDTYTITGLSPNTIYAIRISSNGSRFGQQVYGITTGGSGDSPNGSLLSFIPQRAMGTANTNIYPMNAITDTAGFVWSMTCDSTVGLEPFAGQLNTQNGQVFDLDEIMHVYYIHQRLYVQTKDQIWFTRQTGNDPWVPATDPRSGAPSAADLNVFPLTPV